MSSSISVQCGAESLAEIGKRALSSTESLEASYDLAQLALRRNIPGDFVECGVFAGVQCAAMASVLMKEGARNRKVHLFDSFLGIPTAGPKDNDIRPLLENGKPEGRSSGISVCSQADVLNHMRLWNIDLDLLVFHPGWFEDTIAEASKNIDAIALLRLDGDLYESTKICLTHLYPKLSRGGWLIVDDYNLDGCREAVSEVLGKQAPAYWRKDHD